MSRSEAQAHVRIYRDSYYKLEWLYGLFIARRVASSWAYATRTYLLMLVDFTIFIDKTFTLVEARYILLFTDLERCSGYSWGAAALVTFYTSEMLPCSVASNSMDILLSYMYLICLLYVN